VDFVAVLRLAVYRLHVLGTLNGDAFAPIYSKKLHLLQTLEIYNHSPKGMLLHRRVFQRSPSRKLVKTGRNADYKGCMKGLKGGKVHHRLRECPAKGNRDCCLLKAL